MDYEKVIKQLEEKIEYAEVKRKEHEENKLIRQSEWYDGYQQAFLEVVKILKDNQ
ncbi:hypothetical protein V6B14_22370 (plasmid) [Sporosarcina psychrophila]|uniref:hypothetical protein n=1 Tax=Sporosarcina psychrophila TaxID=1476 RepID=UPI0030D50B86